MAIWMVGIDHNKANIDIRSTFSFTTKKMAAAYEAFLRRKDIDGCVILSTCNRMELWLSTDEDARFSPFALLCSFLAVDADKYRRYSVERRGEDAVRHLFRLAAGLESKIVGEDQVITQVGDALAYARSCYATDNTLEVLFRMAVTAGKRVRTETDLSTADRSVIHTALDMLEKEGISVRGKNCMVIGNGMMGRISSQTLMDYGAAVTVTVRQYHKGVVDIPQGCARIPYDDRYRLLPDCDMVVSATNSPNYTLTLERLKDLDVNHEIPMIDLAVPRDIDPGAEALPWTRLYDIDAFHIDLQSEKFKWNLEKAEAIMEEEREVFLNWYTGRDLVPLIQSLKQQAGTDVAERMTPYLKHAPLDGEDLEQLVTEVEGAASRMMNNLLFELRKKLSEPAFQDLLDAMNETFSDERVTGKKPYLKEKTGAQKWI